MSEITPTTITEPGLVHGFGSVADGGDAVDATGFRQIVVEFFNSSGAEITVTLDLQDLEVQDPIYGKLVKSKPVIVLQSGEYGCFSLAEPYGLANEDGFVEFAYSTHTGLKIRALRL